MVISAKRWYLKAVFSLGVSSGLRALWVISGICIFILSGKEPFYTIRREIGNRKIDVKIDIMGIVFKMIK